MPESDDEHHGVQIDLYGVRMNVVPSPTSADEPRNWRDVAQGINKDLMAVVSNTFSLLADTLRSARSLVRGIGAIPSAVAAKLEDAHAKADRAEEQRAAIAVHDIRSSREAAIDEIQKLLRRKRVEGFTAELVIEKTQQRLVLCILPPTDSDEVRRIATAGVALSLPGEESPKALPRASSDDRTDTPRKRKRRRRKRSLAEDQTSGPPSTAPTEAGTPRKGKRFRRRRRNRKKPTEG